jgi:hypothetical protein
VTILERHRPAVQKLVAVCLTVCCPTIATTAVPRIQTRSPAVKVQGIVTVDDDHGRPVRRATVTISEIGGSAVEEILTDPAGRFSVDLLAGSYTISVVKAGYISSQYGASPGLLGSPLRVSENTAAGLLRIHLRRGSSLEGTIYADNGRPLNGIQVNVVVASVPVSARRSWVMVTDDLGRYRLAGLFAGEYRVSVEVPESGKDSALPRLQGDDVDRVVAAVKRGTTQGLEVRPGRAMGFRHSTVDLTLLEAQELSGVDLTLTTTPLAVLTGEVRTSDGKPASGIRVLIKSLRELANPRASQRVAVTASDGTFRLEQLVPDAYRIVAEPTSASAVREWGVQETLQVDGDEAHVQIELKPAASLSGRIIVEGSTSLGALKSLASRLRLIESDGRATNPPVITTEPEPRFVFSNLPPGRYELVVSPGQPFIERASTRHGTLLDPPFLLLSPGQVVDDALVEFTAKPTELQGHVLDSLGRPTSQNTVVVFPADRALWGRSQLRVREVRPSDNGQYEVRGLLPGAYYVGVRLVGQAGIPITVDQLLELVPLSVQTVLESGRSITLNLQIR